MEKNEAEMKEVQKVLKSEVQSLKELKEGYFVREEKERKSFYEKVSKELESLKTEMKEEGQKKKTYVEAITNSMAKLEKQHSNVAAKVAKEVVQESRIANHDRTLREKNVMIFGIEEASEDEDDEKLVKKKVDDLFELVGAENGNFKIYRLKKSKNNTGKRAIKISFAEFKQKKKFLSLLYKLQKAPEKFKSINVQHDLSQSEREHLNSLLKKAKEMNTDPEKPKEFSYKVRGPPNAFTIKKIFNRAKN